MPALIGRDLSVAIVRGAFERARGGNGGLVLVAGEAGIGKSALVADAADAARRTGALVAGGASWDRDGAPGYWPWTQVVRALRRKAAPAEWTAATRVAGPALFALLGEPETGTLGPSGTVGPGGPTGEPDGWPADPDVSSWAASSWGGAAFSLHEAVTTVLTTQAQHRPVAVVLEDLHRADDASLRLLRFMAQHIRLERLLILGTYRDTETGPAEPLLSSLAAKAQVITLTGLDRTGVAELVTRVTGRAPEPEVAAELHRRTGGNPFYVQQLAHLPQYGGAIPSGVRAAVTERLSLLPPGVQEVLAAAAVLGHEFGARLLATTTGVRAERVERLLAHAVAARLIVPAGGDRFAFAHDLVGEVVYASLPEEDRWRRHAAVAAAHGPAGSPVHVELSPAEMARHVELAGPALDAGEVMAWLVRAARDAAARMATEEAVRHARRALELIPAQDPRTRALGLLDLGTILHHHGDATAGYEAFEEAAEVARRLGDDELLARAALVLRRLEHPTRKPPLEVSLIREAHRKLAPAGTATGLDHAVRELSIRTAALARGRRDDEALGLSLLAAHDAMLGPGTARDRLAIVGELAVLARRTGDRELDLHAARLRTWALLEQGDPRYLGAHRTFVAAAERAGLPRFRFDARWDQATVATLTGRFDLAAQYVDQALAADRPPHVDAASVCRHLRWALELRRGRLEAAEALLAGLDEGLHPYPHLVRAATVLRRGDIAAARRHLHDDAGAEGHGWYAPLRLRLQAEVAAAVRDPAECARALAVIGPFAGEWAVPGMATVEGPMAHWAALLHAALERWDEAIDGFTAAWHAADRLQARPWSIEARLRLADALLVRGHDGDAAAARAHLDHLERESAALGTVGPGEQARRLRSQSTGPSRVFRFDGTVWTLTYAGRTVRVPDAKGLHDLRVLLRRPGVEVPALRLAGVPAPGEGAKAGYRDRLTRLGEEIARALRLGDDEQAARLDQERLRLVEEIQVATERAGDAAERARKTVSNRIRAALARLDRSHPDLAHHLRASISTGRTCRYQPVSDATWQA
ncbi:AAA family ATPase [Nonomuraea diastatica]|uniref:ATPase n=1 Tax=Nonomuraea diastatica TaxID=1848329 RepID=A0A4R4W7E2_9ACTN|nr:AAA family ATPase [Nonomuraea diastatica]TDD12003.1 ATPase [Nonomuraea diastatica]